jgi:hypothetical protein
MRHGDGDDAPIVETGERNRDRGVTTVSYEYRAGDGSGAS